MRTGSQIRKHEEQQHLLLYYWYSYMLLETA